MAQYEVREKIGQDGHVVRGTLTAKDALSAWKRAVKLGWVELFDFQEMGFVEVEWIKPHISWDGTRHGGEQFYMRHPRVDGSELAIREPYKHNRRRRNGKSSG